MTYRAASTLSTTKPIERPMKPIYPPDDNVQKQTGSSIGSRPNKGVWSCGQSSTFLYRDYCRIRIVEMRKARLYVAVLP